MGLRIIYIEYQTPLTSDVIKWFIDTFGSPQEWGGEVLAPTQLKSGYQWANGKHVLNGNHYPTPCIWCTEKAYMMYKLRWL